LKKNSILKPASAGIFLKAGVVFAITNRFFMQNPEKSNRFFGIKATLSFFLSLFINFLIHSRSVKIKIFLLYFI
jgi:hypothetical protein